MVNQKTHTERQHERALQRKQQRKQNQLQNDGDDAQQNAIPLLNLRIAISAVIALLAVAIALKAFEVPVREDDESVVVNLAGVGIDDANIFFTYARNVAAGHGAVYYPGGESVEGYSSTLFMLLCSVGFMVTDNIEFYVLLINAVFFCGTLISLQLFLHGMAKERLPEESQISSRELLTVNWAASILLWAWLLVSPAYVIWTTVTLMDVGLWTFVFVSGSLATVTKALQPDRSSLHLNLWIVLMLLTRPEAYYLCLVWIVVIIISQMKIGISLVNSIQCVRPAIFCYLITVIVLTAGRYLYFGYPLPNTYYAKVSSDLLYNLKLGVGYLVEFLKAEPWAGAALLMNFLVVFQTFRPRKSTQDAKGASAVVLISLITLFASITPVLTGGDHFNYFRFYQPYWPLMALAGLYYFRKYFLVESLPTMRKPIRVGVSTLALIGTMLLAQTPPWTIIFQSHGLAQPTIANEFQLALGGRQLGAMLTLWNEDLNSEIGEEHKSRSLGSLTTGGIGYTYRGPVLDMLGLNNVEMAHSGGDRKGNKNHAAFDKDIFFEQSPDFFAPRRLNHRIQSREEVFPFNSGNEFWATALKGLDRDERFLEKYSPIKLIQHNEQGLMMRQCTLWIKNSLLSRINVRTTKHFSFAVISDTIAD